MKESEKKDRMVVGVQSFWRHNFRGVKGLWKGTEGTVKGVAQGWIGNAIERERGGGAPK